LGGYRSQAGVAESVDGDVPLRVRYITSRNHLPSMQVDETSHERSAVGGPTLDAVRPISGDEAETLRGGRE
jgi:hypothetical protein